MQLERLVLIHLQDRLAGTTRLPGGVAGTVIWSQDLGVTEAAIDILPLRVFDHRPVLEPLVGPDNILLLIQQQHAIGHAAEDQVALQQSTQ